MKRNAVILAAGKSNRFAPFTYEKPKGLFDKLEPHTTNFMAALGIPIYFSKGDQTNIKTTTKEDLLLFEGYLLAKQKHESL